MMIKKTGISLKGLIHGVALASCLGLSAGCASSGGDLEKLANAAGAVLGQPGSPLTNNEIVRGLKEALTRGSQIVVKQVGQPGGYTNDSAIRVPLPRTLEKARKFAGKVGMDGVFSDFESKLNEAAEVAAPKARSVLLGAIQQMTLSDAEGILRGPDNAATQYFQRTTSDKLKGAMRPIIDESLSEVGAVGAFNELLASYRRIPLAPKVDADITSHVLDEGLEGLFFYIAREEKAIRDNPLKRSSELLRRVFGS